MLESVSYLVHLTAVLSVCPLLESMMSNVHVVRCNLPPSPPPPLPSLALETQLEHVIIPEHASVGNAELLSMESEDIVQGHVSALVEGIYFVIK